MERKIILKNIAKLQAKIDKTADKRDLFIDKIDMLYNELEEEEDKLEKINNNEIRKILSQTKYFYDERGDAYYKIIKLNKNYFTYNSFLNPNAIDTKTFRGYFTKHAPHNYYTINPQEIDIISEEEWETNKQKLKKLIETF